MKNKILSIIFFFVFYSNVNAQELDTLFYNDGRMTIWNSKDLKELRENKENGTVVVRKGNYRKIDKNGELEEEMTYIEYDGENHYKKTKWKKGNKVLEIYEDKENEIYTDKRWNDDGQLVYQANYNDDKGLLVDYYSEFPNNIHSIQKVKLVRKKERYNFTDNDSNLYWVEITDSTGTWIPSDNFMKFHNNGNLKEKGNFLPARYQVFNSQQEYEESSNNEKIKPKFKSKFVKNGEWVYYGEDGKIEKIEFYERGKLIKREN